MKTSIRQFRRLRRWSGMIVCAAGLVLACAAVADEPAAEEPAERAAASVPADPGRESTRPTSYDGHIALATDATAQIGWGQVWERYRTAIVAVGALIALLIVTSLALLTSNRRQRRLKRRARRLNQRLSELSQNVPGVLYQFRLRPDGSSHFPFASNGLEEIYGCRPVDVIDDARPVFDALHPDDFQAVSDAIRESAESMQPWHQMYRVRHPRLGTRWVSGSATPSRRSDGSVTWHGYIRDVTEFQNAVERVRTAASVFEASREGISIADGNFRLRDINQAFAEMTGYSLEEVRGRLPGLFLPVEEAGTRIAQIGEHLEGHGQWKGEIPIRRKSGETFPAEVSISTVTDEEGRIVHYVALISDITLRKMHENELDRIASLDALTGIGNRRQVDAELGRAVNLARTAGARFAICMMDLDGFKPVNDRHGHEVGDKLLTIIAARLQNLVRAGDFVGRMGGDEFVLILKDPQGETVFERIIEVVRKPIDLGDLNLSVTASLGATFCDAERAPDPATLLRDADQALYRAKSEGRDRYRIFTPDDSATSNVA